MTIIPLSQDDLEVEPMSGDSAKTYHGWFAQDTSSQGLKAEESAQVLFT